MPSSNDERIFGILYSHPIKKKKKNRCRWWSHEGYGNRLMVWWRLEGLDLLLQQLVRTDELAGCSHTSSCHHWHSLHATKALAHACREVSVFGVRWWFFERAKLVLAFILFLLSAIASVGTIWAITSLMRATMSGGHTISVTCQRIRTNNEEGERRTVLSYLSERMPCYSEGKCRVFLECAFSRV